MKPLYNNYVRQPVGIFMVQFLVVIMVTVVCADMLVGSIKDCFLPEELQTVKIHPVAYELINDCIAITTEERGFLVYQDAIDNHELLIKKIEQGIPLYGSYPVADEKYVRPLLWELKSEDHEIDISIQDTLMAGKKSAIQTCAIFSGVLLIIWGFFLGSTYVLYNAPLYPRLAKLLIREEFRNF